MVQLAVHWLTTHEDQVCIQSRASLTEHLFTVNSKEDMKLKTKYTILDNMVSRISCIDIFALFD